MTDENQGAGEEYLELAQYIEDLEAGHATQPPVDLTPEQRRIYRMAAFFCFPFPRTVEPRPKFVEALRVRLLAMVKEVTDTRLQPTRRTAVYRRTRASGIRCVRHHRRSPGF
jgi:hypothetical protein